MNYFLGLNISNSPMTAMVENFKAHNWILFVCALAIPVLAGLSQWLNTRLMPQAAASPAGDDSSMESSMKMMNNMMPLVSVFFCLSLPIDHAANRNFIQCFCFFRLSDGFLHIFFVCCHIFLLPFCKCGILEASCNFNSRRFL